MKNLNKLFVVLFLVFVNNSCSEDFIDLAPLSEVSVGNFYNTESDMEQAVVAAYSGLQSTSLYRVNFLYLMEGRSDNSEFEDTNQVKESELDFFREAANNEILSDTWNGCYVTIQRCNIVLNRIDAIDMDENLKAIRKGEVQFIRALTYFNMVRMWGELPAVLNEVEDPLEAYAHVRQPTTEVYDAIIDDLQIASGVLPNSQSEAGRVTKGAALALLAKVYLTIEEWSSAVTTSKQVEAIGYQLLPNYADVFDYKNENNAESIFEVQFKSNAPGEGSLFRRMHIPLGGGGDLLNDVTTGVGFNLPTQDLYDAFENNDLRRSVTVEPVPNDNQGRLYCDKFTHRPEIVNDEDNNFIVLRYADVILMLAEAINETGYVPDGEAFNYLNSVRLRAGVSTYNSSNVTTQEAFREAVLQERRLELSLENHRWFDLLRTGKAIEVMQAYNETRGPVIVQVDKHELYPIPQAQIKNMNSPNFQQNPGY